MNARTIKLLKKKFITMFMQAILLVMIFMGVLINVTNVATSHRLINNTLSYIAANEGALSELEEEEGGGWSSSLGRYNSFSSEFNYSVRFFMVTTDQSGGIVSVDTEHIARIDETEAADYARQAVAKKFTPFGVGRIGYFYYQSNDLDDGDVRYVFLDCSSQIQAIWRIMSFTVLICLVALFLTWLLLHKFSDRIIQPELENMKRQKQFITNASHELKTPVAVIRANTELEEMLNGESEWSRSTMRQVDRLNGLIQNLVMIARSQEAENSKSELSEIDVSNTVQESVDPFAALAIQDKKTLESRIEPDIRMVAEASLLQQLTSLLVDNAIKYCDPEGTVLVTLQHDKNSRLMGLRKENILRLTVSNSYADGASVDYSKFFDRFYREDQSHNADKGGYGIGLSVAESITEQFDGTIRADWKDGMISFICDFPFH